MTQTFEEKIRTFNGFTHIKMNMVKPISLNADMEMKSFNILVGANNAGKSLCNKINWATTLFFTSKIIAHLNKFNDPKTDEENLQFIFDKTFDGQFFEGEFEFYVRDELLKAPFYCVKYKLENGKIKDIVTDYPDDTLPAGCPIYLSTYSRNFENIERYLKTKKLLGIDDINGWDKMEKLTEWFKLYDISAFESFFIKFKKVEEISSILDSIKHIMANPISFKSIEVDAEECKIYCIDENNNKKRMSTLGAGEQSVIIMMLSSI